MFDLDGDEPLRLVIGEPNRTSNRILNDILNQSGVTPSDVLSVMREQVELVRLDSTKRPRDQLLTGKDFLQGIDQGKFTFEDVAEFIVRPVDLLGAYIDLIDSFLEVQHLPRIHMRGRHDVLFVQDHDLLQMAQGPPADVVRVYSVVHMFGLGNIGTGLYENQVVLVIQNSDGEQGLLEVFWEGDWKPEWRSVEPDSALVELIYTLLGAVDIPRSVVEDLFDLFRQSTFEPVIIPHDGNVMTGIWEYRVLTGDKTDSIKILTYWAGEDTYGVALWLNDVPLHDPRQQEKGTPSPLDNAQLYRQEWVSWRAS